MSKKRKVIEYILYVVAFNLIMAALFLWTRASTVMISTPIETHLMPNGVTCYTYVQHLDCLQVDR